MQRPIGSVSKANRVERISYVTAGAGPPRWVSTAPSPPSACTWPRAPCWQASAWWGHPRWRQP